MAAVGGWAKGFSAERGRCRAMIYVNEAGQCGRCGEAVEWSGDTRTPGYIGRGL